MRVPYDESIPNLPQFRPVSKMPEQPGWGQLFGAAFQQENTVAAAWHMLSRDSGAPDYDFDFEARAKKSELFTRYPQEFLDVKSAPEFDQREQEIAAEERRRQLIAAGGTSGIIASMIAGVLDPTVFLPVGSIYRGVRGVGLVKSVMSMGVAGATGVAAQEAVLQADQRLRTPQESATAIIGGFVLGGLLGGGLNVIAKKELQAVASDMASDTMSRTVYQPSSLPSSLGAVINPDAAFANLPVAGKVAPAFGAERIFTELNPVGRVMTQDTSPTARSLMASLDTGGLATQGAANLGGDVEALAKQHMYHVANALWERGRVLTADYKTRIGGVRAFNEAVVLALRRGGASDDPVIANYTAWLRQNFFEPLRKEAEAVGLQGFQNLEEDFIAKYAPRFAKKSMISRDYGDFMDILQEHFTERLTSIWSKRVEGVTARNEVDKQIADILELDEAGLSAKRQDLEAQMANLPAKQSEQARAVAERILQLRDEAKGAARDEAKKLRAEANEMEKSNKELLGGYLKEKRKLQGQFRLLGHTQSGIAGANRRIVQRIEAVIKKADATRSALVKKLNKLAHELEGLGPEARDAAIDDAVDALHRAKDAELRALEKEDIAGRETAMQKYDEIEAEFRAIRDLDTAQAADRITSIQEELIERAEGINAKRRTQVDALKAKLRNPNLAKAEAAKVRSGVETRWNNLVKRAAQDNVNLTEGGFDISARAREYAEQVASAYAGENTRLPFFNLMGGERGPELSRMLDIDETRTWSNGRKFEEFLENDLEIMLRRYARTLSPDIELQRKFGTVNPLNPSSPFMKRIEGEFQAVKDKTREMPQKAGEKKREQLSRQRENTIRDLQGVLERVRNLRGIPENPNGFSNRAGRVMLNLNTTRMMGKVVISSVSDLAMAMARHGPARFLKDGMLPMISNWKALKLSMQEIRMAGTALDLTLHGRAAAFGDIFDDLRMGTKAERGLQYMANNMGFVSGMDLWNTSMKTLAGHMTMMRLTQALENVAAGKATKSQLFYLDRFGIDETYARTMTKELAETSTEVNGVRVPNTEDWGKAALAAGDNGAYLRAMEARRVFRSAIARDVDDTIVTPGAERPLWMDGSMMGRLVGQFRSFTFSSTQKVLVSGLQSARQHGVAQGSIMAASTAPFFLASGALSYYLWGMASGERARTEMLNADWDKWALEATLRGMPLGVLGEVPNLSEDLLGKSFDSDRTNFASSPADLLGPSFDLAGDVTRFVKGLVDKKSGLSKSETSALRQVLPYNNLFIWDSFVRSGFGEVAR